MENKITKPTRKDLIELLDGEVKRIEDMPPMAMHSYVTHYDIYSVLVLVLGILRSDDA